MTPMLKSRQKKTPDRTKIFQLVSILNQSSMICTPTLYEFFPSVSKITHPFGTPLIGMFCFGLGQFGPLFRVHFLDDEIHWKKFRRRMLGEGADLDEIVEVFEAYDTDRDYLISQRELQRMIAHVTTHHNLDNPALNRVETSDIRQGKKLGFVPRYEYTDILERLDSINEHIPDIESQLVDIGTKLSALQV